jgi:hypothetical protein
MSDALDANWKECYALADLVADRSVPPSPVPPDGPQYRSTLSAFPLAFHQAARPADLLL